MRRAVEKVRESLDIFAIRRELDMLKASTTVILSQLPEDILYDSQRIFSYQRTLWKPDQTSVQHEEAQQLQPHLQNYEKMWSDKKQADGPHDIETISKKIKCSWDKSKLEQMREIAQPKVTVEHLHTPAHDQLSAPKKLEPPLSRERPLGSNKVTERSA